MCDLSKIPSRMQLTKYTAQKVYWTRFEFPTALYPHELPRRLDARCDHIGMLCSNPHYPFSPFTGTPTADLQQSCFETSVPQLVGRRTVSAAYRPRSGQSERRLAFKIVRPHVQLSWTSCDCLQKYIDSRPGLSKPIGL
jgi:hypothetical protein